MDFIVTRKKNEDLRAIISNKNLPACIKSDLIDARETARVEIKKLKAEAELVDFRSTDASGLATDLIGRLRAVNNQIEKARKAAKDPYIKAGKSIDNFVKEIMDWVGEIVDDLSGRQKRHIIAQQNAAMAAIQEAHRKQAEYGLPPAPVQVAAVERLNVTMAGQKTDGGSMKVEQVFKFKVLDPGSVPLQFLMVNEKAVQAAIDAGIREIPGIDIFPDIDLKYRAKNS